MEQLKIGISHASPRSVSPATRADALVQHNQPLSSDDDEAEQTLLPTSQPPPAWDRRNINNNNHQQHQHLAPGGSPFKQVQAAHANSPPNARSSRQFLLLLHGLILRRFSRLGWTAPTISGLFPHVSHIYILALNGQ
eukprot:3053172-Rhodomonas_salina.4